MKSKEALLKEYREIIKICEMYHLEEYLEQLRVKLCDLEEPLKFMIVGEGKSGKSTLLNALVGREIAEVDDEPKTWCINVYYNTAEAPYAELVYADGIERVSMEQAQVISERIGTVSCKQGTEISEKDNLLKEIRWHMKLDWPKENVILIDTPGFNQVRRDTFCRTVSIDGLAGIQYEAEDGFEGIQYKADLLLWCFDVDNVGDEEVENKLKNVPIDASRIYGIVTKLDRKDPRDRERLFIRNEKQYKKYVKQCLKSSLPTVFPEDSKAEAEEKQRMRKETVDGIRWCIEYLLKNNTSLELIKVESSAQYLQGIKKKIALVLKLHLGFYFENIQMFQTITNAFNADQKKEYDLSITEIDKKTDNLIRKMADRTYLLQLWTSAGENAEIYTELLRQHLNRDGISANCNLVMKKYQKAGLEVIAHYIDNIKWKKLLVARKAEETAAMKEERPEKISEIQVPHMESLTLELGDMGLAYKISKWANEIGLGSITKVLFGQYLREKAVELGSSAVTQSISACAEECRGYIDRFEKSSRNSFLGYITESFVWQTGLNPANAEKTIVDLERLLTEKQWYGDNIPFYPYWDKKEVIFMQAKYFPKLSCYHTKRSEIKKWVENKIIYPAMKEHEKRLEKSILVALESYDGTKTVRMPDINREQSEFLKDVEIQKILPCVKNVEWEELKEKLEDSYQLCLTVLIKRSNEIWEKQCQEVVEQFVKKKGDELFHNFWKEYLSFVKEWESCMKSGLDARISGNELFQIPPECEYGYFYQYYYYPTHTTELTVWLVYDYEMKQQIPGMLLGQMKYVAPDGTALDVVFEKRSRELLDVLLNQMKKKKMQVLQKWDDAVNRIYEDVCKNYEQIFLQLEQTVETSILPLWEGYKQNTEGNSNRRIQTILDFIKKGNMLPKIYVRLLEGYVSQTDLGMAGYCIYSDGKNVYDKMTAWVKNRAETAQKKWS